MNEKTTELLVYDQCDECPYLAGRRARMPLRYPTRPIAPSKFDACLAAGDRRSGVFIYRTECPGCQACEAIRIDVSQFVPSRTQRRVLRRSDEQLTVEIGAPVADEQRVWLYNAHREVRGLVGGDGPIDLEGYRAFLVESCCDTFEMRYLKDGQLVAVAVCDRGAGSMSAVYCYFDPAFSKMSPGVYSVLKQIELCRRSGMQYLYLGYYIAESSHMSYKSCYLPHERLINGRWHKFTKANRQRR